MSDNFDPWCDNDATANPQASLWVRQYRFYSGLQMKSARLPLIEKVNILK